MENKHLIWLVLLIIVASALRLVQVFPPNFNPIGAIALLGAAYLPKRWIALIVPLLALWLSNLVLNNTVYDSYFEGFHWIDTGIIYLGASFLLIVWLGFVLLKKVSIKRILLAAVGGGVIFYVVSNFGFWLITGIYPMTFDGLLDCYIAALPFFRNTLLGNITFCTVLFGAYALITQQKLTWSVQ